MMAVMSVENAGSELLLIVSDEARKTIVELRADEPNAEQLALWVEVTGFNAGTYTYDVYFQSLADAGEADGVVRHDDLSLVVPGASIDAIRGSTLEIDPDGGMTIRNPNPPPA